MSYLFLKVKCHTYWEVEVRYLDVAMHALDMPVLVPRVGPHMFQYESDRRDRHSEARLVVVADVHSVHAREQATKVYV